MSASFEVAEAVGGNQKQAVLDTLSKALACDQDTRRVAEERLKAFEVVEEFSVHLCEIFLDDAVSIPVRQLASVVLNQYVVSHWSRDHCKFVEPIVSDMSKMKMRSLLPIGLGIGNSKLRNTIAMAMSTAARWDWPESWPGLLGLVVGNLHPTAPQHTLEGTMQFLESFTMFISSCQVSSFVPGVVSELHRILGGQNYSSRIKMKCVRILTSLACDVQCMKNVARMTVVSMLERFGPLFAALLQAPGDNADNWSLKAEVLRCLTFVVSSLETECADLVDASLPAVWELVKQAGVRYKAVMLDARDMSSKDDYNCYCELVVANINLINMMVESERFSQNIADVLPDMFYYAMAFMQISPEMESSWSEDVSRFVEDEMDDSYETSVRMKALELLAQLTGYLEERIVMPALCQALDRHTAEGEALKMAGDPNWWKSHETCMLALGNMEDILADRIAYNPLQLNLLGYLENWHSALNHPEYPFLLGRCIWMAAQYSPVLRTESFQAFIRTAVCLLQSSSGSLLLSVSSLIALSSFLEIPRNHANFAVLVQLLPAIFEGFVFLFDRLSGQPLVLLVQAFTLAIRVDECFTASVESKVIPLTVSAFLKCGHDTAMVSSMHVLVRDLCRNDGCVQSLHHGFIPTLTSILNASPDKLTLGLQAFALEILTTIVKFSYRNLNDHLASSAFCAVYHCIMHSEDHSVLQNGGDCLRCFVHVASGAVLGRVDADGKSGLEYVLEAVYHLLDPNLVDFVAPNVGRLVVTLIEKGGPAVGPQVDFVLKSALSKMQTVETLSGHQSLLVIFTYLLYTQTGATVSFLATVPGPTGNSALEFVLKDWLSKQTLFYGIYERRLGMVALCKLLEYGVSTKDERLEGLLLAGDSQSDWGLVPLLVKVFKVILSEFSHEMDKLMNSHKRYQQCHHAPNMGAAGGPNVAHLDEANNSSRRGRLPADVADGNEAATDDDGDEEDDIMIQHDVEMYDPIYSQNQMYQMDMDVHLFEFVRRFCSDAQFPFFVQFLTPAEKKIIFTHISIRI